MGYGGTLEDMEPIGGWIRKWGCEPGMWEVWRELGGCWEIWGDTGRGIWGGHEGAQGTWGCGKVWQMGWGKWGGTGVMGAHCSLGIRGGYNGTLRGLGR